MATSDLRSEKKPVAVISLAQTILPDSASAAVTQTLENMNGVVKQVVFKGNDATNAITYTLKATAAISGVVYTKASIGDNGTTVFHAPTDFDAFLLAGDIIWSVDPSGDPGASTGIVDVDIYME